MASQFLELCRGGIRTLRISGTFDGPTAAAALSWVYTAGPDAVIDLSTCEVVDHVSLEAFVRASSRSRPNIIGVRREVNAMSENRNDRNL